MPEQLSFDLNQLVRVCLNDPDLRAEIFAAIDSGPLPVRTPVATVKHEAQTFSAILKVDREKAPGEDGFVSRDGLGWLTAKLSEVMSSAPDASTMSADQVASQMGITTAELLKKS
ncbi:MAG TPA: hypothetical protein VGC41_15220 [Kofleriaceae bacterium]